MRSNSLTCWFSTSRCLYLVKITRVLFLYFDPKRVAAWVKVLFNPIESVLQLSKIKIASKVLFYECSTNPILTLCLISLFENWSRESLVPIVSKRRISLFEIVPSCAETYEVVELPSLAPSLATIWSKILFMNVLLPALVGPNVTALTSPSIQNFVN